MKVLLAILVSLGWFALIAQFCISINSGLNTLPEIVTRYFSYFTITTNLLVAVCCSSLLLFRRPAPDKFFSRESVGTAVAVYITIVGIIYNLILRFLWQPTGLQWVVDELLHLVIPILFLIYWLLFVAKGGLRWNSFWPWLIYPLLYVVLIFIRGAYSGFYPYPFLDVSHIGFTRALINSAGITVGFLAVSLLYIGLGKWQSKRLSR